MLRAILVLCLIAGTRQIKIKEFVVPASVELGDDAELHCSFEANGTNREVYVKWWQELANGQRKLLYQRMPPSKPHVLKGIELGSATDEIVIKNVTSEDSGRYECEVANLIEEDRKIQMLSVYSKGTGPNLTLAEVEDGPDDDDDDNDIMISCTADDVTPEAELIIYINKKELNNTETLNSEIDSNGLHDYYVNVTVSKAKIGDYEVGCELFYKNKNISHPPYVSSLTLKEDEVEDNGDEVLSTTNATLDESVDDHSGSVIIAGSWVLLIATLIPSYFAI